MTVADSVVRLEVVKSALEDRFEQVSVRGVPDGPFLFVEHHGRAVEASACEGRWWLEFWDCSEDADAAPDHEQWIDSNDGTVAAITNWLSPAGST